MYSFVYVRVHVCTLSFTSWYMDVPTRIHQGTYTYSVICNCVYQIYALKFIVYPIWLLKFTIYRTKNKSLSFGLAIYNWAIVPALCFGCFRLAAIFTVVVSVCTITACMSRYGQYRGYRCTITLRGAVDQITETVRDQICTITGSISSGRFLSPGLLQRQFQLSRDLGL